MEHGSKSPHVASDQEFTLETLDEMVLAALERRRLRRQSPPLTPVEPQADLLLSPLDQRVREAVRRIQASGGLEPL